MTRPIPRRRGPTSSLTLDDRLEPVHFLLRLLPCPAVPLLDLADQLSSSQVKEAARAYVKDASVAALPSEERFKSLLDFLKPKAQAKKTGVWSSQTGGRLAKVVESDRKLDISIDKNEAPEFAEFVLEHLQTLFAEYRSKQ